MHAANGVDHSFLQNSNFFSPTNRDNNIQQNFKLHGGVEVGDKIVFGFAKNELSLFADNSLSVSAKQYEESGLPSSISLLQDSSPYHYAGGKRPIFPETPVRGIMKHSDAHFTAQQQPSQSSDDYSKRRRSFSDGEGSGNFNHHTTFLSEMQSQRDDGLHKLGSLGRSASSSASQQQQHPHSSHLGNQPDPVAVPLVVGATYTIQLDVSGCPIMVPWTAPYHQSIRSTSPLLTSPAPRSTSHRTSAAQMRRSFAGTNNSNKPARQSYTASYTTPHFYAEESPTFTNASKEKTPESKFQSIYKEYYSLDNGVSAPQLLRTKQASVIDSSSSFSSFKQHRLRHQQAFQAREMPVFSTPTFSRVQSTGLSAPSPPSPPYSPPTDSTSITAEKQSEFWRKRLASRELTTVLRSPQLQY